MQAYFLKNAKEGSDALEGLAFVQLGSGFFFEREVRDNVKNVVESYSKDKDSDWAGFEYSTNKLHLEDEIHGSISDIASSGVLLVQRLADRFKTQFPDQKAVFWLGFDEFGIYPSVTMVFYVKREGMIPLLPEDDISLESFQNALLVVT